MLLDKDNEIVKLCAEGMMKEGEAQHTEAAALFKKAWDMAADDFEKCIAAHYLARHQASVTEKLNWDLISLNHALNIDNKEINAMLPSLYLNVGKCYEDLSDHNNARVNYNLALSMSDHLAADGYGDMIRNGIQAAIQRVAGNKVQS